MNRCKMAAVKSAEGIQYNTISFFEEQKSFERAILLLSSLRRKCTKRQLSVGAQQS